MGWSDLMGKRKKKILISQLQWHLGVELKFLKFGTWGFQNISTLLYYIFCLSINFLIIIFYLWLIIDNIYQNNQLFQKMFSNSPNLNIAKFQQYFIIILYLPIVCEDWDILMVLDINFHWIDAKFNYRKIIWS